jgi:hypothetical protein
MLSPHISSAFVQERQSRYRREAEAQRLVTGRPRRERGATASARRATADPPRRLRPRPHAPSPAH